eukprot:TRINITY_DN16287_c0_g1_i1.p1 TRINITY_DN16287_c0_g1~~TRINITY_DN16287_c0_g1_i1.p1  ORF type:complete len:129 (+),score=18.09 TRINITY_DN16287_c0_g1_i1:460-846(+)
MISFLRGNERDLQVLAASSNGKDAVRGTLKSVMLDKFVGDPFSDGSDASLASYWTLKGYPYTENQLKRVKQVRVELRMEENPIYTYPADKVWRCNAFIENMQKEEKAEFSQTQKRLKAHKHLQKKRKK